MLISKLEGVGSPYDHMRPPMHIIRGWKHKGGLTRVRKSSSSRLNGGDSLEGLLLLWPALRARRYEGGERQAVVVCRVSLAALAKLNLKLKCRKGGTIRRVQTAFDTFTTQAFVRDDIRCMFGGRDVVNLDSPYTLSACYLCHASRPDQIYASARVGPQQTPARDVVIGTIDMPGEQRPDVGRSPETPKHGPPCR